MMRNKNVLAAFSWKKQLTPVNLEVDFWAENLNGVAPAQNLGAFWLTPLNF
jgi:hypothetical protein